MGKIPGIHLVTIFSMCLMATLAIKERSIPLYQIACKNYGCDSAFNKCSAEGCIGSQCDRCMTKDHPECTICINEFDDDSNYLEIGSKRYLICDPDQPIQRFACEFSCRRNYFTEKSLCLSFNKNPICTCSDK